MMNDAVRLMPTKQNKTPLIISQKSPLKWAGGKRKLVPEILKLVPKKHSNKLIEPFVGGGSVFLNSNFDEYILVDSNPDLISLFFYAKKDVKGLITSTQKLFNNNNNCAENYYALREKFNLLDSSLERTALFLYLNRFGYNGLCRYNLKGGFNVPFGSYKKPYFPKVELEHLSLKLQSAEFLTDDFSVAFEKAKSGDIIYCDPPYSPVSATSSFTAYSGMQFTALDHERLVNCALEAKMKGVTTIISNHALPLTKNLYKNADKLVTLKVARSINCKGSSRKPINELLALYKA